MTMLLKITAFAVPACAMLAVAHPATAADNVTAAATAAATTSSAATDKAKAADARKYCINVIPDTGSRTARRMCKTRAEWADQGVDLDAQK